MTDPVAPPRIRLRTVPASAGLSWIRRGFRTFVRRPGGFMGLFGFVLLILLVLAAVPPEVEVVATLLMPLLSLGYMVATQDVLDDLPVRPTAFWRPMRTSGTAARALLNIGAVYLVVVVLIVLFGDRLDGGESRAWMLAMSTPRADGTLPEPTEMSGIGVLVVLLKSFGLAVVSIPLWHAPALVHWGRQRAAQAMFSSIVALWRTRAAFIVYLLGWAAIGLVFVLAATVIAAMSGNFAIAVALMTPVMWPLSAVFYVTLWFGFVDTFEITPAGAEPARLVRTDDAAPGSRP